MRILPDIIQNTILAVGVGMNVVIPILFLYLYA